MNGIISRRGTVGHRVGLFLAFEGASPPTCTAAEIIDIPTAVCNGSFMSTSSPVFANMKDF